MPLSHDNFTEALRPVRAALLRQALDEWSPKLRIDGAAKVLSSSVEIAETLAQWTIDTYHDQPYSVTVLEANAEKDIDPKLQKLATISTVKKVPDDSITHAISHISVYSRNDALWVMKRMFYSLIPKGIAVVTCSKRNPIDEVLNEVLASADGSPDAKNSATGQEMREPMEEGDLTDLAEEAQFERGKIRSYQKEVRIEGEELERLITHLRTSLETALGPCEAERGWRSTFDGALKQRLEADGSLKIEAELILAMRWDLLSA